MNRSLAVTINALGLYAVALVLAVAFGAQLWLGELPCPLCLLQRIQFAMLAIGPILNVRFGPRPCHYAVSLLTAAPAQAEDCIGWRQDLRVGTVLDPNLPGGVHDSDTHNALLNRVVVEHGQLERNRTRGHGIKDFR